MLKTVEEIRDLRQEVRQELGGDNITGESTEKWTQTHVGVEFPALRDYINTESLPEDAKAAFLFGVQMGAAARERNTQSS